MKKRLGDILLMCKVIRMSWKDTIRKTKMQGPAPKQPRGSTDERKTAGTLASQINSNLQVLEGLSGNLDVIYNVLEIEGMDELIRQNKIRGFTRPDHFIKSMETKIELISNDLEDVLEYFRDIHKFGAPAQERQELGRDMSRARWTDSSSTGTSHPLSRETTGYRDSDKPNIWDDSSELEERYRKKKR